MIIETWKWLGGYKGIYQDSQGNKAKVEGTWALGPFLSWFIWDEGYFMIDGKDQGRIIPEQYRI